jgi:RNAse (barnase) inhibitor barstar
MDFDRLTRPGDPWLLTVAAPANELHRGLTALEHSSDQIALRTVRGRKCATKQALLDEWSAAFQFGPHFGENWDALLDALTDTHALKERGYVVLVSEAVYLLAHEPPEQMKSLVGVLTEAHKRWLHPGRGQKARPFHVVLQCSPAEVGAVTAHWQAARSDSNPQG